MPMGKKKRSPKPANASRREFSAGLLRLLNRSRIPYRVGGTYAMNVYLGMDRKTKDVDIFCHPGDYPRILKVAEAARYRVEVEDERWIAKIRRGRHFCDVVFGSANGAAQITDQWFTENVTATISSVHVKLLPPTEMIWSKVFILDRIKCDVNDVAHLILRQGERVDWKRLFSYMDMHWEVLLFHLLYFRYVYPSERNRIPQWLLKELLNRLHTQMTLPPPETRVCRGRIFSRDDYLIDIKQWGFADLVGDDEFP